MPEYRVDFAKLGQIGKKGVWRAAAFVALGRTAWNVEEIRSLTIEGPFTHQLLPDPLPPELADQVKLEFRSWIIGNALLEIERNLALFLDEAEVVLRHIGVHGKKMGEVDFDALKRRHDDNVRSKAERLHHEFGIDGFLAPMLSGWASARNCLSHNNGLVRPRDVTVDDCLEISRKRFQVTIGGQIVPHEKLVGYAVEKDSALTIQLVDETKGFPIGARIELSEQEMIEICLTADFGVDDYVNKMVAYSKEVIAKAGDQHESRSDIPAGR